VEDNLRIIDLIYEPDIAMRTRGNIIVDSQEVPTSIAGYTPESVFPFAMDFDGPVKPAADLSFDYIQGSVHANIEWIWDIYVDWQDAFTRFHDDEISGVDAASVVDMPATAAPRISPGNNLGDRCGHSDHKTGYSLSP
jgi:hypothetical protein